MKLAAALILALFVVICIASNSCAERGELRDGMENRFQSASDLLNNSPI